MEIKEIAGKNAHANYSGTLKVGETDTDRILKLDIPDIAAVYGGIRGRTMSSRHQNFAWPTLKECGIRRIIDLREDGTHTRLEELCRKYGMEYFHFPVDNTARNIEEMARLFPELCRMINEGEFYISCAMGLHRTDIALCCYWMFYGADRGLEPPEIRGYRKISGHDTDKIMRVLNAFYRYVNEKEGRPIIPPTTFKERKKTIAEISKAT